MVDVGRRPRPLRGRLGASCGRRTLSRRWWRAYEARSERASRRSGTSWRVAAGTGNPDRVRCPPADRRIILGFVAAALLLLIGGRMAAEFVVELLWYRTLGYERTFWTLWGTGLAVRAALALPVGLIVLGNLWVVARSLGTLRVRRRYANIEIRGADPADVHPRLAPADLPLLRLVAHGGRRGPARRARLPRPPQLGPGRAGVRQRPRLLRLSAPAPGAAADAGRDPRLLDGAAGDRRVCGDRRHSRGRLPPPHHAARPPAPGGAARRLHPRHRPRTPGSTATTCCFRAAGWGARPATPTCTRSSRESWW